MDPEGFVGRALARGVGDAVREDTGAALTDADVAALTHMATALLWGNVAAGLEPRVDSIIQIMRAVIEPKLS